MKINDRYFLNPAHLEIAKARYFLKDSNGNPIEQDIGEVFERVVNHIYQDDPEHKEEALRLRQEKKIIDAGRPLAQAGTKTKNLLNCFVIPIEEDTREAIAEAKRKHFNIQAHGGGVGINFSVLRPNGSICKSTQSRSSGAVGFVNDFSYQSSNISQGGNRSGANLGVLEDWHPDLYEFITKKSTSNWENIRKFATVRDEDGFSQFQWNNHYPWQMFNVSVLLSDDFIERVKTNDIRPWKLVWGDVEWHLWKFVYKKEERIKKVIIVSAPSEDIAWYKAASQMPFFNSNNLFLEKGPYDMTAKEWFSLICKNAWEDGCPGVLFFDRARAYHNGEFYAKLSAANPCAEELLPANDCCTLTSLALPSFFKEGRFDWDELGVAVKQAVRGLDNIVSVNETGEQDVDAVAKEGRRIGLGTTGGGELLVLNKLAYSSQEGRDYIEKILKFIRDKAYEASIQLAQKRGPFPAFQYEGFSKSEFFKTLPKHIQKGIKEHGIRNVTVLTQPPVGTTGTMIGYSTGCEPYFAMCYNRNSRVGSFIDGSPAFRDWLKEKEIEYADYQFSLSKLRESHEVPSYFEEAHEISWEDHLKMQAVFSKYSDSSVSKTINMPNSATAEDVENAYLMAYNLGIKSTTVYRDGSKQQILEHVRSANEPEMIGDFVVPQRPKELKCDIHHTSVRGEKWTVLVGLLDNRPYEVFCAPQESFEISPKYKTGKIVRDGRGSYYLDTEDFKLKNIASYLKTDEHKVISRILSTAMRFKIPVSCIVDQLAKADGTVVDFSKAILRVLKKYGEDTAKKPECFACGGENVVVTGGCPQCLDCGASKCG